MRITDELEIVEDLGFEVLWKGVGTFGLRWFHSLCEDFVPALAHGRVIRRIDPVDGVPDAACRLMMAASYGAGAACHLRGRYSYHCPDTSHTPDVTFVRSLSLRTQHT